MLTNINPTETEVWKKLQEHFHATKSIAIKEHFKQDLERADRFSIHWKDFYVDYSTNRISQETMDLLLELAHEMNLNENIQKYFDGDRINETESRAVLHTALREKESAKVYVDGKNIIPEIYDVKQQLKQFSDAIISGNKKGHTGKAFTDVVNIGIGGSDLGPAMVTEALQHYKNHLNVHFVSMWMAIMYKK